MAKKKNPKNENETKVEEDLFEGAEDLEAPVPGEGVEEEALGEETGELTVPEGEAEDQVAAGAEGQKLTLDPSAVPQAAGLNPGDEINLITKFRVIRGDEAGVEVEAIDFTPTEEMEAPEELGAETPPPGPEAPGPAGPGGLPPVPGGGGLAGLV